MTDAPELSIGGGGSVTMMSNRSVGRAPGGFGRPRRSRARSGPPGPRPRPGSTSRTSCGTDGTSSTASVLRPAISARAERVPIPNATTSARFDVRPGDERQDRHELRVDGEQRHRRAGDPQLRGRRFWPAWTDAISSSSRRTACRPSTGSAPRSAARPCPGACTRRRSPRPRRPTAGGGATLRGWPEREQDRRRPHWSSASTHDDRRRADRRHQDERDDEAAEDGADRVRRRGARRTRRRHARARRGATRMRSGRRCPRTIVTGSTTSDRPRPNRPRIDTTAARDRAAVGRRMTRTGPRSPDRRPRPGPPPALGSGP